MSPSPDPAAPDLSTGIAFGRFDVFPYRRRCWRTANRSGWSAVPMTHPWFSSALCPEIRLGGRIFVNSLIVLVRPVGLEPTTERL